MGLDNYLGELRIHLKVEASTRKEVLRELRAHLEDKSEALRQSGVSEEEASRLAMQLFGPARLIAQQICEMHNQGNWRQAFFAALPHLLVALLFSLHYWQSAIWISIILVMVSIVAIYGWCHGRPAWLFPWLGYYLLPVMVAGSLLIYLPGNWTWLVAIIYVPLALFILVSLARQILARDWLYVSLMLLPIPIVLGWVLALGGNIEFVENGEQLQVIAPWVAVSFLALAVTVVTFIRVRRRWVKVGALLVPMVLILLLVSVVGWSNIGLWGWLILTLASLLFLFSPVLLEHMWGAK